MNARWFLGMLLAGLFLCSPAHATPIIVDEFGTGIGTLGLGFIAPDPGPGGLSAVLTYRLPFAGVVGDVLMAGTSDGGAIFDVVRFNGNGTLIFYSDNVPTADAPADTTGPPGVLYGNVVIIQEIGPEGNNQAIYTPLSGQPGFNAGFAPTYTLISDGRVPVPEAPPSFLLGAGLITLLGYAWRQKENGV